MKRRGVSTTSFHICDMYVHCSLRWAVLPLRIHSLLTAAFSFTIQEDVERLVRISDDFRRARRDRVCDMQRERAAYAEPPPRVPTLPAPEPPSIMIDKRPARPRESDRVYDREVVTEEVRSPSRWSYVIDP